MAFPEPQEDNGLGFHKGLPIIRESAQIQKGARVLSQTMEVTPFGLEPGGKVYLSMLARQTKERFDNIMSADDPDVVLGYERVVVFDALGAVQDDRPGTAKSIASMMARVKDRAEKEKAEKAGAFRLTGVEPVPDADGNEGEIHEIRPGVPDDEEPSI